MREERNFKIVRRTYGEHLTSIEVFKRYILPTIVDKLYDFVWVDLFCGEGNLILPMLEQIPENERTDFFRQHIFLFDIQEKLVKKCVERAISYGIPREIAEKNIVQRDTIKNYPSFITKLKYPVFHITNPPYLYKGYIPKTEETKKYLQYFKGENKDYQDLYQLALINDLRHGIEQMIYVIPSNFLFGFSVSNKIRDDFLKYYTVKKAIIFERRIFEYTGTNVIICFFERKPQPRIERIVFKGIKINKEEREKEYVLDPKKHYRAGGDFEDFVDKFRSSKPLKVKYYLTLEEVRKNCGNNAIRVIDANDFEGGDYKQTYIYVNDELLKKIKSNTLFVRTLDTGSVKGRAGLFQIKETFGVDGILVSKVPYRTHPIQIFLEPSLPEAEQLLLQKYFNTLLEYFREKTDSEFLTTYKYSKAEYIRKYLGLSQVRKLIQTFPILELSKEERANFERLVNEENAEGIIKFLQERREKLSIPLFQCFQGTPLAKEHLKYCGSPL